MATTRHKTALLCWLKRLALVAAVCAAGVSSLVLAGVLWLNSGAGLNSLLGRGLQEANAFLLGTVEVGDAEGHLLSAFTLHQVAVKDADGHQMLAAEAVEIRWLPLALLHRQVAVRSVTLAGVDADVAMTADGLNLLSLLPPSDEEGGELPVSIQVQEIRVTGDVRYDPDGEGEAEPYRLQEIETAGALAMRGSRIDATLAPLRLALDRPAVGVLELAAAVTLEDGSLDRVALELRNGEDRLSVRGSAGALSQPDLDLQVTVTRHDLDRLQELAALPLTGVVALEAEVAGPLDDLTIDGHLTAPSGSAGITARLDTAADPLAYELTVDPSQLDLSSFVTAAELPSSFTGRIEIQGQGITTEQLEATVDVELEDSQFRDYRVGTLTLNARVQPELDVVVERLATSGPLGQVDIHGRVRVAEGTYWAAGRLSEVSLAEVSRAVPQLNLAGTAGIALDRVAGGWAGASGLWVEAAGEADVFGLRAPPVGVGHVTASFDAGWSEAAGLSGKVQGDAYRLTVKDTELEQATAHARLLGSRVEGDLRIRGDERLAGLARGAVDWSGEATVIEGETLTLDAFESSWEALDTFRVALRPGNEIHIEGLRIQGDDGRLAADGTLALSGTSSLQVGADRFRLAALQPLLSDTAPHLSGTVKLDLTVDGAAGMPHISLQIAGKEVQAGSYGPFELTAGLVVVGGMTTVVASAGGPEIQPLVLQGVLPLQISLQEVGWRGGDMLQLFAEIPLQDTANLSQVLPQASHLPPSRFGLKVSTMGVGRDPVIQAQLRLRDVAYGDLPVMTGDVNLELEDGEFETTARIRDVRADLVGAQVNGTFDLGGLLDEALDPARPRRESDYLKDIVAKVDLVGVPLETAALFTDALQPAHGMLVGDIELSGSAADPELYLDVQLRRGRVGDVALDQAQFRAQAHHSRLDADMLVTARDGGIMSLAASAPVALSLTESLTLEQRLGQPGLDGWLSAEEFPFGIAAAFVPGAGESSGELEFAGTVSGSLLAPRPELLLSMERGSLCMEDLGVCYSDITVDAHTDLEQLELSRFTLIGEPIRSFRSRREKGGEEGTVGSSGKTARAAKVGKRDGPGEANRGSLSVSGTVVFPSGDDPGQTELEIRGENFWVLNSRQVKLRSDVKLAVRGSYPDLRIRGKIKVPSLKVELGDEMRRSAWPLDPDPGLIIHRKESPDEAGPVERRRLALLDHLDLDVELILERNCWIYLDVTAVPGLGGIRPDIQLEGEVGLVMRDGVFTPRGEVRTVRGNLTVLSRQFNVDEGLVIFTGASPPDPVLDVAATHHSRYGDILVTVEGRTSAPQLAFSSDEITEQADILSVLMFGAPTDELRAGQAMAGGGELSMLAGMAGAQVNQFITRLVGHNAVDMLNLENNPAGPGSFGVEVGKTITDGLFLITRYRFGVDEDENSFEGQLEITLSRSFILEIRYGDAGNGGLDLYVKKRLKAPRSEQRVAPKER